MSKIYVSATSTEARHARVVTGRKMNAQELLLLFNEMANSVPEIDGRTCVSCGRPVDVSDSHHCRSCQENFAKPRVWPSNLCVSR